MERPAWTPRATCRGSNPDDFFPSDGKMTSGAREACSRCPVRKECLEYGLHDPFGIWGGRTWKERQQIISRRREWVA